MECKNGFEKIFEEKFYYGYNNRQELLEALIYFANHELHMKNSKYSLKQQYQTPKQYFWEDMKKRASQLYLQFYRFVDLNDIPTHIKTQNPSSYFDYNIAINPNEIQEKVADTMKKMKEEGKINIYLAGIYFIRELEGKYGFYQTEYDILCQLEALEKTDKLEYYDKWITAKCHRASNSNKQNEEVEIINKVYELFQKRKEQIKRQNLKSDQAR